jgi:hypothetical protein
MDLTGIQKKVLKKNMSLMTEDKRQTQFVYTNVLTALKVPRAPNYVITESKESIDIGQLDEQTFKEYLDALVKRIKENYLQRRKSFK